MIPAEDNPRDFPQTAAGLYIRDGNERFVPSCGWEAAKAPKKQTRERIIPEWKLTGKRKVIRRSSGESGRISRRKRICAAAYVAITNW